MNRIPFLAALFFSPFSFSQSFSASIDTSRTAISETKVAVSVTGPIAELQSLTVDHFSITGTDTLSIFHGVYDLDESDPSGFTSFEWNETSGILRLGTGKYESQALFTRITLLKREDATTEVITIN